MTIIRDGLQTADLDFPVVAPILSFDFANSQKLDPRITFSRATRGTRVNEKGFIETIEVNQPRFDHDPIVGECRGLLIEEDRVNYFPNTPTGYSGNVSTGTATGADGQLAQKFVPNAGYFAYGAIGGDNVSAGFYNFSLSTGETIDVSFSGYFASLADGLYVPDIVVECSTAGTTNFVYAELNLDLTNGTIRSYGYSGGDLSELISPQITLMPFGMYKVTWTVRYTQGSTIRSKFGFYIQCRRKQAGGGVEGEFYADGTSGFQFSCIQYEVGSYPTSYIPTTTSTANRSKDLVSVEGNNFPKIINNLTELSIFSSTYCPHKDRSYWSISSQVINESIRFYFAGAAQIIIYLVGTRAGGGYTGVFANQTNLTVPPTNMKTFALITPKNFTMISNDGNINYEFTSQNVPRTPDISTFTILFLGQDNGFGQLNGCMRKFAIYPKRITNQQASFLTN